MQFNFSDVLIDHSYMDSLSPSSKSTQKVPLDNNDEMRSGFTSNKNELSANDDVDFTVYPTDQSMDMESKTIDALSSFSSVSTNHPVATTAPSIITSTAGQAQTMTTSVSSSSLNQPLTSVTPLEMSNEAIYVVFESDSQTVTTPTTSVNTTTETPPKSASVDKKGKQLCSGESRKKSSTKSKPATASVSLPLQSKAELKPDLKESALTESIGTGREIRQPKLNPSPTKTIHLKGQPILPKNAVKEETKPFFQPANQFNNINEKMTTFGRNLHSFVNRLDPPHSRPQLNAKEIYPLLTAVNSGDVQSIAKEFMSISKLREAMLMELVAQTHEESGQINSRKDGNVSALIHGVLFSYFMHYVHLILTLLNLVN